MEREKIAIEPNVDTTDMVKIGAETTETLVYTPSKVRVKQIIRQNYHLKSPTAKAMGYMLKRKE